jgi:hypothetical protein
MTTPTDQPTGAGADLRALAMQIRYDLTAAQGKLTELIRQTDALKLTERLGAKCPLCTLELPGPNTLAEHLHVIHDGPLPEHWLVADALVEPAVSDASEKNEGSEV